MIRQIISCDCCNRENIGYSLKVKMPIIAHSDKPGVSVADMDLCNECANKFLQLYYKIAQEHNYSGLHGFYSEEDTDDE